MGGISLDHGSYSRPFFGERANGDGVFAHQSDSRALFAIIDGLGHGEPAAAMTRRIITALRPLAEKDPQRIIERLNEQCGGDLGAVIGVLEIDTSSGESVFAGVGDTTTYIFSTSEKKLVSGAGILGHQYRPGPAQRIRVRPGDLVMMHSDGVSRVRFEEVRKFARLSPPVVAKKTVVHFGTDYADATCLVIKVSGKE
jgi:serine phosphatase RsbU (regulator of sigma subunit)